MELAARRRIHRRFSIVQQEVESASEIDENIAAADRATAAAAGKQRRRRDVLNTHAGATGNRRSSAVSSRPGAKERPPTYSRRYSLSEGDYAMPKVYEIAGWKAHNSALVSIQHVGEWSDRELILTASTDCNVSIWTLHGAHIGIFGQSSSWSLSNPTHWLSKEEHKVKRPKPPGVPRRSSNERRRASGGVLDDGDGGKSAFRRLKVKMNAAAAASKKKEAVEGDDSKKLLSRLEGVITESSKKLENYHYELAKARLEKKVMLFEAQKKGSKGSDSPIVKEAMWNSRWGVGLRSTVPDADHNEGTRNSVTIGSNGMHEVMIRKQVRKGGGGSGGVGYGEDGGGAGLEGSSNFANAKLEGKAGGAKKGRKKQEKKMNEVQKRAMERMKILRSGYNQVAHQLGVHAVENVDDCKGAELVMRAKMKEDELSKL